MALLGLERGMWESGLSTAKRQFSWGASFLKESADKFSV